MNVPSNLPQIRFNRKVKFGIAALTILIAGPLSFFLAVGVLGITSLVVAAAIAAGVAGVLSALLPAASQWLTNLKFKTFKAVVSRDPINSLISEQADSARDLKDGRTAIEEQIANVEELRNKMENFSKNRNVPLQQLQTWQSRLEDYEKLLAHNVELFKAAKAEHENYGQIIEIAELEWDMAMSDAKLSKAFNKKPDDFMRTLRQKTALDAVQKASANSRARLKMALLDSEQTQESIRGQEQVHAINYNQQGKVDLGTLLEVREAIPMRAEPQA